MPLESQESESFFALVRVILHQSIRSSDDATSGAPIRGYYVRIGLKAEDLKHAERILVHKLEDGEIDWKECVWYDVATIEPDLSLRSVGVPLGEIWYQSGKIYFS